MTRGTTPTLRFHTGVPVSDITKASVVIKQGTTIKVDKRLTDCETSGTDLTITLSEAETLALDPTKFADIQLRLGVGDARLVSQIITVCVEDILKDGALA